MLYFFTEKFCISCKALAKTEFHWQDGRGCTAWAALSETLLALTLSKFSHFLCDFLPGLFYLLQRGGLARCNELSVWWLWCGQQGCHTWVSGCPHPGQLGMQLRCPPAWRCLIYACFCHSPSILMVWGSLPHLVRWLLLLNGSAFLALLLSSTLGKPDWTPLLSPRRLRREEMEEQRALVVCLCLPAPVTGRFSCPILCPKKGPGSLTSLDSHRYRHSSQSPSSPFRPHSSSNSCSSLRSFCGV